MKAFFRVDGSAGLGTGHALRCLVLARALHEQGVQVVFACRDLPGAPWDNLAEAGFPVHRLPPDLTEVEDAAHFLACCGQDLPDIVVVDVYALSSAWQSIVMPRVPCLVVIDDLANRPHACDVLLDQNFHKDPGSRYQDLLPPETLRLLGPAYALLRPEFLLARQAVRPRDGQLSKVLIFFTGGDDLGETLKSMEGLARWARPLSVDVVIGRAHPHPADVERACPEHGWRFHQQINDMARLMADADLCIGACGSSSWERCALGVPALVTVLADNQAQLTDALHEAGVVRSLGWHDKVTPDTYADAVRQLSSADLARMSHAAWGLVDGMGPMRASQAILSVAAAAHRHTMTS